MSMTDPIADMLARIRNALQARHERMECPASNLKVNLAKVLLNEGYLKDYYLIEDDRQNRLVINLKYMPSNMSVISGLKRISRPGRRLYVKHREIPKVRSGLGIAVLSTSKGILTDHEARKAHVGGEVLFEVW